jgi:hypothetical protein
MNPYLAVLILLLNAAGIVAFIRYRNEVLRLSTQAQANADSQAAQIAALEARVNHVHECTLILGTNQNNAVIQLENVRTEILSNLDSVRADVLGAIHGSAGILGKQFDDFAYGIRVVNARVKKEEAARAVQEAERARIAEHRLAQARPAEPVSVETLAARRKASGLVGPGEITLPGGAPHPQNEFQEKS